MARNTIVMDLNRCVGCMSCNAACKTVNEVEIGNYWTRIIRVENVPADMSAWPEGAQWYYLPMQCQHCAEAPCVNVCPTGASHVAEDGTVQVTAEECIGCESCMKACPYSVRYIDAEKLVAMKCTMCADLVAEGNIPQCVSQCVGMAKWFGDLDEDPSMKSFRGGYDQTLGEACMEFSDDQVYTLPDDGNGPAIRYILRGKTWDDSVDFSILQGGHGHGLPNY